MKKKWKPKIGGGYWTINLTFGVSKYAWRNDDGDREALKIGNVFRYKKAAQAAFIRVLKALKGLEELYR